MIAANSPATRRLIPCRDAALTPLAYGRRMIHPVDGVLNRNWEHGIRMLSMASATVVGRGDDLGATIASRPKATRSISKKRRREFHNARDSLSRYVDAWRRRISMPTRPLGMIEIQPDSTYSSKSKACRI